MDIECFGCINWVKVSEILLEGIIVGATVVLAYMLGRMQSDRHWKRELEQREKEQKEKEENTRNLRRIDELLELQEMISSHIPQVPKVNSSLTDRQLCLQNVDELIIAIDNVSPLFGDGDDEKDIRDDLVQLSQDSHEFKRGIEAATQTGRNAVGSGYLQRLNSSKELYNKKIQYLVS